MIHIATVHYKTDKWINIQLEYLRRYINQPYRVYSFLCGEAVKHRDRFFYSSVEPIKKHSIKLNILADIIYFASDNPKDVLIFIDGDAFPIAPLDSFIEESLNSFPVAAIQRVENLYELQPHPSFCVTTIDFWKKVKGDWKRGYEWITSEGDFVSGVGGNLLKNFEENGIQWGRILRTSENPYHKVFFGVYGNTIYHHGAGFHKPLTKCDMLANAEKLYNSKFIGKVVELALQKLSIQNKYRLFLYLGIKERRIKYNTQISNTIYQLIMNDAKGFLDFLRNGRY